LSDSVALEKPIHHLLLDVGDGVLVLKADICLDHAHEILLYHLLLLLDYR